MSTQANPKSIAPGHGANHGPDLTAMAHAVHGGRIGAESLLHEAIARADDPACAHAYLRRCDEQALATARSVDAALAAGLPVASLVPLAGLAVSIKDLFDIAGLPTTAASAALADAEPAAADCTAVARLRAAGAAITGHTNLSEFAFSGVGINPHHGTPANPATAALNATPRIPGGSTSGGAVSVATGAAWAALGSDTGGSIRIPAALQGLVGFKNTQALTPLDGAVPLSTTLDTACLVTRSVRDAVLLHGVLAARRPTPLRRPLAGLQLAVPGTVMLDGLDADVARTFELALARLRSLGARIDDLPLPALSELAGLQAQGGFAAAESWAWHRQRLADRGDRYDPRVATRIRRGEAMSAADYIDLIHARQRWIRKVQAATAGYDALLSPTVPMVAPPLAPLLPVSATPGDVAAQRAAKMADTRFVSINTLLLRNPSVVNMLDGCALSLPCQSPGQLPVGLMVWAEGGADDRVLGIGLTIEAALAQAESR